MNTNLVIKLIGLILTLAVVGIVVLAVRSAGIPDVLQNIAVGALTGLLGLLAPNSHPADPPPPHS